MRSHVLGLNVGMGQTSAAVDEETMDQPHGDGKELNSGAILFHFLPFFSDLYTQHYSDFLCTFSWVWLFLFLYGYMYIRLYLCP
jgi:hypothetical protein